MNSIFPEITEKITRLEVIKNDPESWEEVEEITSRLTQLDGFKKHALQQEILRYFGISDEQLDYNVLMLSG